MYHLDYYMQYTRDIVTGMYHGDYYMQYTRDILSVRIKYRPIRTMLLKNLYQVRNQIKINSIESSPTRLQP